MYKKINPSLKVLSETSIFIAIGIFLTTVIKIPISIGFIHIGDFGLFLAMFLFPLKKNIHLSFAFAAMFADFILGFVIYSPISFLTRISLILFIWMTPKLSSLNFVAWLLIPLNYFLYDLVVFDLSLAINFLLFNFLQILPIYVFLITKKTRVFINNKTTFKTLEHPHIQKTT